MRILKPTLQARRGRLSLKIVKSAEFARCCRPQDNEAPADGTAQEKSAIPEAPKKAGGSVNLYDPAATISRFLTRRFGIVGGLAFVALLASTEGYEIVKALLERDTEGSGDTFTLDSGVSYKDIKVGGGSSPSIGDFVAVQISLSVDEEVLFDTKERGKAIAFVFGKKPFTGARCEGLEQGLSGMKRGGKREMLVPSERAFGEQGVILSNGAKIGPNKEVRYVVELVEVSPAYFVG